MFQLFLRTRGHGVSKQRLGLAGFRARSAERDAETDRARVGAVMTAIETALRAAENEQTGLARRVEEVLARAAVTLGNGTDEYLEREALDSHHQDLFDAEIVNGQRRLKELATEIAHFRFMKAAALSRFPDYKATATAD
jgi:hypothetical protein